MDRRFARIGLPVCKKHRVVDNHKEGSRGVAKNREDPLAIGKGNGTRTVDILEAWYRVV